MATLVPRPLAILAEPNLEKDQEERSARARCGQLVARLGVRMSSASTLLALSRPPTRRGAGSSATCIQEQGDDAIEAATYFLVSEALTNVAKHARAGAVSVEMEGGGGTVAVTIADDGVGGADAAAGSGLTGLADRVNAVGGRLEVSSARGEGTRIRAVLPTNVLGSLNGS